MIKKLFFFSILLLSFFTSFSQAVIVGEIVDVSDIGIPYADILLIDEQGNWTNDRTSSEENGEFKLSTNETGKFKISVISIGFEKYESDFFLLTLNSSINLQKINLEQESFELNDVDVTASRKLAYKREIDRTIIDLESDSSTTGSTILDVLERTPGVVVDRQNQSISMLGKSGVNVMINGKISYMPASALVEFLNGMNAENAKGIELITTPPAKFDAEGNAGYINIDLKKNLGEGYNGNISSSLGIGDDKAIKNSGVNFNVSKPKSNLLFNYSILDNELPINFEGIRRFEKLSESSNILLNANRSNNRIVQNLRFSYDFDLIEKINLGTTITGYSNQYRMTEDKSITFSQNEYNPDLYLSSEDNFWKSVQSSVFLTYSLSELSKIDISTDYLRYSNDQPIYYNIDLRNGTETGQLNLNSLKSSPFEILVFALDYESDFGNNVNFTSGFKFISNDFTNKNELFRNNVFDNEFGNNSRLDENIAAAYSQFKFNLNDKIKLQTGIRYEHTNTLVNSQIDNEVFVDRNYGSLFPSLFIGYKINDFNNLNFSASRRINRPAFTDMAPFVYFVDLNQTFQGNVSLQPSFTNNIQVDYRFKAINLTFQYSDEKDLITRFQPNIDPENGSITITPDNITSQKTFSTIFSYSFYPISKWNLRFFTTYSYVDLFDKKENNSDYSVKNSNVRLNLNNSIDLGKDFSFQVWGFYNSRTVFGRNIFLPQGSLNISFQKKSKNFTYTLNAINLFDSQLWRFEYNDVEINYFQRLQADFQPPQIKFAISMNFGDQSIKTKKVKESEEAKRIRVN